MGVWLTIPRNPPKPENVCDPQPPFRHHHLGSDKVVNF